MLDFKEQCELLHPLIAVYTSHSAHESANKNGLDFAQLLLPFSSVLIQIKDPITQQEHEHELRLDLRDLRRSGFLLSHTVFRFVLQESILSSLGSPLPSKELLGFDSILSNSFYQAFLHWFEPSEHEFLRTYLACIYVVSTADSDPLSKLAELQSEQHCDQQTEGVPSRRIQPAHCVEPKWFFPNILKYYVLLHDNSLQDIDKQRSEELLNAIYERYGKKFCSFIILNSANPTDTNMPDIWYPLIKTIQKNLQTGLTLAKQNLYSQSTNDAKIGSQNNINLLLQQKEQPASLVSVSSTPLLSYDKGETSLFTTNAEFSLNQVNQTYLQNESTSHNLAITETFLPYAQDASKTCDSTFLQINMPVKITHENTCCSDNEMSDKIYGQWLSVEDRIGLQKLVQDFVREALVPFVEKHLSDQNELVTNRRSLAKSTFSSVKKWLQNATTNPQQLNQNQVHLTNPSNSINNTSENIDWQARRLADLAFLFGLYQYSNHLYQSLKKEFANDQAWLHHVGCLEMAGISSFLHGWQQLSRQIINPTLRPFALANLCKHYPQRYLNNAIHLYANVCRQPFLALRALMNSVLILSELGLYSEAAQQLIQFNALPELMDLSDLIGAVLLEHSARIFGKTGNRRRKIAFYLVIAATHVLKFVSKNDRMSEELLRRSKNLSRRLYSEVMSSSFTGKGWQWADNYLLYQYTSCS